MGFKMSGQERAELFIIKLAGNGLCSCALAFTWVKENKLIAL
jgi:hypothetical protein